MNTRTLPLIVAVLAIVCAGALFASCSKKDSTSPPITVTGPRFNFAFPLTLTSHQRTFTEVGTWNYICTPHVGAGMTGTVIVSASSGLDSVVVDVGAGGGFAFSPSSVTIKATGYVRWVNVSGRSDHTVTR